MKPVFKAILLALALMVFTSVAFCQDYPEETDAVPSTQSSFQEGTVAGKKDGKGNGGYALGGALCGPFGVLAAVFSDPQPDPQKVVLLEQSMGTDYASAYSSSFSQEARKNNLIFAVAGWAAVVVGVSAVLYINVVLPLQEDLGYYDNGNDPHKPGIKITLGNPAAVGSSAYE